MYLEERIDRILVKQTRVKQEEQKKSYACTYIAVLMRVSGFAPGSGPSSGMYGPPMHISSLRSRFATRNFNCCSSSLLENMYKKRASDALFKQAHVHVVERA